MTQTEDNYVPKPRPTGAEQCTITQSAMGAIPPNSNPFRYDDWSMGTEVGGQWIERVSNPGVIENFAAEDA